MVCSNHLLAIVGTPEAPDGMAQKSLLLFVLFGIPLLVGASLETENFW